MKKTYLNIIGYITLLLLAGTLLLQMCKTTNQAIPSFIIKADFIGEYSFDGDNWQPLNQDTKLSAFDGDLLLRGQLSEFCPLNVCFYLNHIGIELSVNGEEVFWSGRCNDDVPEMMCGSSWTGWEREDLTMEDEIEIRLHNPHSYGNPGAYNEFLDSLYYGGVQGIADEYMAETMPYKITGIFMIVVSLALLGMALGYLAQRLPSASLLWSMGLMSLFMGGYLLMDTIDICLQSYLIVFNTCVRQFCIMFGAFEFVNCIRKMLTGKGKKIAGYLTITLGLINGILLLLSIADVIAIYDTSLYWAIAQGLVLLVLLFLCFGEYRAHKKKDKALFVSGMVLSATVLLELVNGRVGFWSSGILVKVVFSLLFVFHLLKSVKLVAVNHRESARAKALAEELRNSRIVLAMSQIRTHFIFNVLTAISGMCEYDPKKADETLIRFSRYLRSNIDIMEEDEPEEFERSMEHLEDYIALEQVRFGNKIRFAKKLEVTDFMIPPLILQPIVENAIKHGLLPKSSGGTIELATQTEGKNVVITIVDDGVGFDTESVAREGSVGLNNVRFRLKQMANGRMDIESRPGEGTKVTVVIPLA